MTSPARLASSVLSFVLLAALASDGRAQNGSNYHVLSNGPETTLIGVGAGGFYTPGDGLGTYIPGEDLRGSIRVDPDGAGTLPPQFCYRNTGFAESVCVFGPGASGFLQVQFPGIYFIELDGLNPNQPAVFTRPVCSTPMTQTLVPYGTGPSSTVSFVGLALSALGPTHSSIVPDNGLLSGQGTAEVVGAMAAQMPPSPTGSVPPGCYVVQFQWVGSAVPLLDGIDGLWHYAVDSFDNNQYWQMSTDEMNLWQSNTVLCHNGNSATPFFSVVDYALLLSSREANTIAALAPHGIHQNGPYYSQTENMVGGGGPNFGFDVGRGSRAVSFSGLGGVKVEGFMGGLGNGPQDPAYGSGTVPTLGFVTWDGKPNSSVAGHGSTRVTWIGVDLAQLGGQAPSVGITKGAVRLPVESSGFMQGITLTLLPVFQHTTKVAPNGWPHPLGMTPFASSASIAGGSVQVSLSALAPQVPCNIGVPLNMQYGTTGRNPNAPPALTFDPDVADISGRRELYLFR